MSIAVFNQSKNTFVATKVVVADTFFLRLKGLLGHSPLTEDEGLLITRCQSIHMFFMRFPIDVIFVSRNHIVVACLENIKPFCLSPVYFNSSYCIEVKSGIISARDIAVGDILKIN